MVLADRNKDWSFSALQTLLNEANRLGYQTVRWEFGLLNWKDVLASCGADMETPAFGSKVYNLPCFVTTLSDEVSLLCDCDSDPTGMMRLTAVVKGTKIWVD